MANTKNRVLRVEEGLWTAAKAAAAANGTTVSAVIREALQGYVSDHERYDSPNALGAS